ncbi:S1 RNA-binding domain-containing protein [uncultured Ilyobacter sp.]|uniref:S1 RNA-binding domain-containing protein n=1 Tax=uncultured Ilyobacter sp. TaxID=544433 RepID=UPI0029C0A898|nr:S1 RNA-binding domain-containing protein [uncultured Ilyobacter sp.]
MKFEKIQIGDELQVRVEKLLGYKASLRSGDVEGFIHKDETDWTRVADISDVVQEGELITAKVIRKIEKENIELLEFTLKKEEENPILKYQDKYKMGNIIEGEVVNIVDYGVTVETEDVGGFVQVSEMSWDSNRHPSVYCNIGDKIKAKIIGINEERGTLSLSMKEVLENPWEKIKEKYKVGDITEVVVEGLYTANAMGSVILNISSGEVFAKADLDGEVEVFLTISNFSNSEREELVGKRVKAEITFLDAEKQYVRLNLIEE